jgi:hypothetical protein
LRRSPNPFGFRPCGDCPSRALANGYGCWLDTITAAIDTVDLSFTGEPDSFRDRLDAARRGVFALIFNFEPNKRDFTDGE